MTQKEKLGEKITALSKTVLNANYDPFKDSYIMSFRLSSNPLNYLGAILVFLLYFFENHFDEKGKFRINILQWPKVIKQVIILITSIISS